MSKTSTAVCPTCARCHAELVTTWVYDPQTGRYFCDVACMQAWQPPSKLYLPDVRLFPVVVQP